MHSGVELKTVTWETAILVFEESFICSTEFYGRTQVAMVGLTMGSVCDEVPRLGSRPQDREHDSKGRGTKMGGGRAADAIDNVAVCGAGRHSIGDPSTVLNRSGIKSCGSARRGSETCRRGGRHIRGLPREISGLLRCKEVVKSIREW
jgi:hypothetical protein